MDIEELRARAMASMPNKKKQQQQLSSDPPPGRSPSTNNLSDTNGMQTPVVSCAPSAPSFSGSHKERDVFLSKLQDLHVLGRSPAAGEKDDNLVIRFSDGESDSDAEENCSKMDERYKDGSFRGNIIGSSVNQSPVASSQMTATSASQQIPGMRNQIVMAQKQLAATHPSVSSAVHVRGVAPVASGEGRTWQSSSKRKHIIGQKGSIALKRVKPGASATKPSSADLENLKKQIATKNGTDLENLRKQIETKENELKLQRHIKSGKAQRMTLVPNGKLDEPGIGDSTAGSTGRQLSVGPASLKLSGASEMGMREDKQKALQVTVQELPDASLKINTNSLQQQRRKPLNTGTDQSCAKDSFSDKDPARDLHRAGFKRPHSEDNPSGRKYLKAAVAIDEKNITTQPVSESDQEHCTRVENNIYSPNYSLSMMAPLPSSRAIAEDFHHTNINYFPERETNKCKVDGLSMGSINEVNLAQGQSSVQYTPENKKYSSVEGFQNKLNTENVQATSREGEDVQMSIVETERQALNKSVKNADIEDCSHEIHSAVEQSIVNYLTDAKEGMDRSSVHPFTEGGQSAQPACENKSTSETSGDVPRSQKTGAPIIFTSREIVKWQARRGPLSNTRLTGIHTQDNLLQPGNISLQDLMKEEELVDKELEEAREQRSRCEMEEKLAWKAYQEAQTAVQAANQRCMGIHKKRERLSAQVRAVALKLYSSKGSAERVQQSKEGFYEPRSYSGLKNLSNVTYNTPFQDHKEAPEQPSCKLNEHSSIMDYPIISSLQSHIGINQSCSKDSFQAVQQNSNGRLPMVDVFPATAKELFMADRNVHQGKKYGSASSELCANQNKDTVSRGPELMFATSEWQKEIEGRHAVCTQSTLNMAETFQRYQSKHLENMELSKSSEHDLRSEDNLSDRIKDTAVKNDENVELIEKLSIAPKILSDVKNPTESSFDKTEVLYGKYSCGINEENLSVGNLVPSLGRTRGNLASGRSQFQHDIRQQQGISSVNAQENLNFTYSDKNKNASSIKMDVPSLSVGEGFHGPEGHHFVSISNKDAENMAVDMSGGSDFEQTNPERNVLPQKRKHADQMPASECGANGLTKLLHASASKSYLSVDSLPLTDKIKDESTASPGAETSTESLHGQNYDHEYNIQFPAQKHEQCTYPSPQSERLLELPGEVVKSTVGHVIDDDVHNISAGTCYSENSLASGVECEKTSNKRFVATFSSLKCKKDTYNETNEERFHSGSSVDEDCATGKENTAVWKSSIDEQAKTGNSVGCTDNEQPKLSDLAVLAELNGGSLASGIANMENQESMQQIFYAYALRNGAAQNALGEKFAQTMINAENTNYYEDANSPLSERDLWRASSELIVVFSYAKDILSNSHEILTNSCGIIVQHILHDFLEYIPRFLHYESPLDMFKSYRIYSNLIAADGVPDKSVTCNHVINPFWPLCKFEHRGKCNNEECPWQHARDYNLTPSQFLEQLKKYSNAKLNGSVGDCKEVNSHGNQDLQTCFERARKGAITRGLKIQFTVTAEQSVVSQGFSCRIISSYGLIVPVYRIGSHLMKADAPMVGALIAQSTWRFWKLGFCQSFSIPFALQRLLLSDMPYLHSVAVREWMLGNNSRLPTCLYSSGANPDDTKKHLFRGLENVECWLELAIDSMNFDSNIDKSDGRKKALCVLSRAIEANPNSVAVWVVYLHMFYRKEKVIGKDDMFHHAVQHNKGSYELWLLFINSRLEMDQRLEAYKNAIRVLCQKACTNEKQYKSGSPYVLDLALQMLNFLSLSGHKHKAVTWIDEIFSSSTEGFNEGQSDCISLSTILACLTKKDACVLWVSCTYFRVYGKLPKAIVERLEFEQDLPFDVEWHRCYLSEASIAFTIKLMNNALSSLSECHTHNPSEPWQNNSECQTHNPSQSWQNNSDSLLPMHALIVNHVKCVSAIESLNSAHNLCSQYRKLYSSCIELVLVSSCIESHHGDDREGIVVFEESLSSWPENKPGIQRFWNQFVGYALKSNGVDFAKEIINKWFFYVDQHKMLDSIISFRGTGYLACFPSRHAANKQGLVESKDKSEQVLDSSAKTELEGSKAKREQFHEFSAKTELDRRSWSQDMIFALLNLAIYRLLNNDPKEAQSTVDKALKAALDDGDVKHCIKECAALALFTVPDGLEPTKNVFDTRMLQLLDTCFLGSQLFPIPKPLSRAFIESIKKPKIRIFIENLLGPIPVDCSLLNSVLEIWHGPSLLPKNFVAFKDLVDFVEGLLELAPANLKLALSVSRVIVQKCKSQSVSSTAVIFWASSLLINSIFQSFPVAPENAWLEVGNFLELLDVDIILEEFYQQALSVHPFSVALWHSFLNFRQRTENLTGVVEAAKQRGIIID